MKKNLIKYGIRLLCFVICAVLVVVTVKSVQTAKKPLGIDGIIDYSSDLAELDITDAPVLENDKAALYIDENYGISLLDKTSGKTWSSNLSDKAAEYFNVAADTAISACTVEFLNTDNTVGSYNSYMQSVMKQQAKAYSGEDVVRLTYIFGERTGNDIIPQALTEKRYEEISKDLDESQKDFLKRRYQLFSVDTMTEADNPDEKLKTFPKLKDTPLYIISDVSGKVIIKKTQELFEEIGYTREDYVKDNELTGFDSPAQECVFKVSYDLRLEDGDLVLTIPVSELGFYNDYPMLSVLPMTFFTSGFNTAGEVLVPAGSGSLMKFGKSNTPATYEARFYGEDASDEGEVLPVQMLSNSENTLSQPVYFFTEGKNTVMTVVESGAEAAKLNIIRDTSSVYAYTSFDIVQSGNSYLTDKKKTLICGSDSIGEDIVIRYRFLYENGYVNNAVAYRDYLESKEMLVNNGLNENPLLLLETVGAVEKNNGELLKLTAMNESGNMLKELSGDGVLRASLKLLGYNSNGLYKQVPGEYKFNKAVGDQNEFDTLCKQAEALGGKTYLQLNHAYYYNRTSFDGFSVKKNTAKTIDKGWAIKGTLDRVEGAFSEDNNETWVLSPKAYKSFVSGYLNGGFKAIGIGSLASDLNSDYNTKSYFDRTSSKKAVVEALKQYKKFDAYISAKNANTYALPYVDLIEDLPLVGSSSTIFTQSVPFNQIVLHGSVEYTTPAVNLSATPEIAVLNAIEMGSGIQFALNNNVDSELFKTNNNDLFATSYSENKDFAKASAQKVADALKGLNNLKITAHSKANNVSCTVYENGTKIFVNYNDKAVSVDGIEIPALGFVRK